MSSIAKKSRASGAGERRFSKEEAQRWLERFDAIAEVDQVSERKLGPRPEWSIETALSMIESARAAGFLSASALAIRESEDSAVRATWDRLRAGLRK